MRKHWILCWLLSVSVVGCAGPGTWGGGTKLAANSQAGQLAAMQNGGAQKVGWTQKVANTFTGKSSNQQTGYSSPQGRQELDPISLGFESGPPNAALYLAMAKLSDQGGNAAHARSMYQKVLTTQPDNLDGMLSLARLEDREGQLDAALHYYQQAAHFHPKSAKALNDLSLCYARRGQLTEALQPLEQAIRLEPTKQLYRNNIAKVLTELNQIDGAVQHLSAVHSPAITYYNMGVLLHQRKRNDDAVRFLTAATQADASFTAANTLLAQLASGMPQYAQRAPASNDHILPTPQTSPYPTTGLVSALPSFQTVPANTASVPVGSLPSMLPPAR